VGEVTAELVADHFKTLDRVMAGGREDFLNVEGIGEQVAASLVDYFSDPATRNMVDGLLSLGIRFQQPAQTNRRLDGRVFLFTGSLSAMSRNEAKQLVKELGGQVVSGLSGRVTDLVAGEKPGSKLTKARERGIPALDETAFLQLVGRA